MNGLQVKIGVIWTFRLMPTEENIPLEYYGSQNVVQRIISTNLYAIFSESLKFMPNLKNLIKRLKI